MTKHTKSSLDRAEKLKLSKSSVDQVHALLMDVTKKHHLACVGKGVAQKFPGLVDRHVYAILGYDARNRLVVIFNPWGNNFAPKGSPGKEHGYPTKNGQFTVPLEEFRTIFNDVIHETDHPLEK